MSDLAAQQDELFAVEAIYPGDLTLDPTDRSQGRLVVRAELPSEASVCLDGQTAISTPLSTPLSSLPPILLDISLPPSYPSSHPPNLRIKCVWMKEEQKEVLYKAYQCAWENARSEVLLECISITQESIANLGITFPLFLPPAAFQRIQEHTHAMEDEAFRDSTHPCPICLSSMPGSACLRLPGCLHIFCRPCLRAYFSLLVKDGTILALKCPDSSCTTAHGHIPTDILRELLPPGKYARYAHLLEERVLRDDPDVSWCPRRACQAPVRIDPADGGKLGVCPRCAYAFCRMCEKTWHGPAVFCKMGGAAARVLHEYQSCAPKDRPALELKYGTRALAELLRIAGEENAVGSWLEENTTSCPSCGTRVEKSFGCNHMTCAQCGEHFCYLCGQYLSPSNPLLHYAPGSGMCGERLFENPGDEIDAQAFLALEAEAEADATDV